MINYTMINEDWCFDKVSCEYNVGVVKNLSCTKPNACDKCAWNEQNGVAIKRLKDKYGYVKKL